MWCYRMQPVTSGRYRATWKEPFPAGNFLARSACALATLLLEIDVRGPVVAPMRTRCHHPSFKLSLSMGGGRAMVIWSCRPAGCPAGEIECQCDSWTGGPLTLMNDKRNG